VGIIFVLKTGIQWEYLPQEMGCGSGMTCWRRLRDWTQAGVWPFVLAHLHQELGTAGRINWERASLDATLVPAKKAGPLTGPNPCDRGRPGSKHHVLCDGNGTPLCCPQLTAANVHETTMLVPMVDAVQPIQLPRGRPRKRPRKLHADKAYHSAKNRAACRRRGILPRIARPGVESSAKLGRHRWKVERTIAWFYGHRRLRIRWERRHDIHLGFMCLACCLVVFHVLIGGFC
jgi:transposase